MKDMLLQIRVDNHFLAEVKYLRGINDLKSNADTIRYLVNKEYKKEALNDCISRSELVHRIANGFLSNNGHADEDPEKEFIDVWKNAGFEVESEEYKKIMECFFAIIENMKGV